MRNPLMILLLMMTAAAACPGTRAEEPRQQPISAEDVDRELVVRFSRAYGMARGAMDREDIDPDADLREPEQLNRDARDELYQIVDLNGLSRDEWQGMLARMEHDSALRDRVESLSTPFRHQ